MLIQKHIRGWLQRKKFVSLRQATIRVQAHARGLLARRWVGLVELVLTRFILYWRPTSRHHLIVERKMMSCAVVHCSDTPPIPNTHTHTGVLNIFARHAQQKSSRNMSGVSFSVDTTTGSAMPQSPSRLATADARVAESTLPSYERQRLSFYSATYEGG